MPKPSMPKDLRKRAVQAIERHHRRPVSPDISFKADEAGDWYMTAPYEGEDADLWQALLFESFGTRSASTLRVFLSQLQGLCSKDYDDKAERWCPNHDELLAAVNIVGGFRPRNEAEACLAAQMVAVHIATMKVGGQIGSMTCPDERTASTLAKLSNAYTRQIEAMQRLKGRRGTIRQNISVRHEKHIHQHVHVHEGVDQNGGQAHARVARRDRDAGDAAVPRDNAGGEVVPLPSRSGQGSVPDARRVKRIGRTNG